MLEFDTPLVAQVERELSEREGVRVVGAHLHLSGYCAQCQEQGDGQGGGMGTRINADERR